MIARAVALDAEKVRAGLSRMLHGKIDKETRHAHLGDDFIAPLFKDGSDRALEIVGVLRKTVIWLLQDAAAGEDQVLLQRSDTPRAVRSRVDLIRIQTA